MPMPCSTAIKSAFLRIVLRHWWVFKASQVIACYSKCGPRTQSLGFTWEVVIAVILDLMT